MTTAWLVAFSGLLGLAVGSFLNVCIYRLPLEQSLAFPASHCTSCNRKLSWFENVPVWPGSSCEDAAGPAMRESRSSIRWWNSSPG